MDKRDRDNSNLRVAEKTTNDARSICAHKRNEGDVPRLERRAGRRERAGAETSGGGLHRVCVSGLTSKRVCGRVTSTSIHRERSERETNGTRADARPGGGGSNVNPN